MAYQDYTSYTEVDVPAKLTVASNTITVADLGDDESSYVYKDFTAGYFSADYEFRLHFRITGQTGTEVVYLWGLCDSIGAFGTLIAADTDLHAVYWEDASLYLLERNATVSTSDNYALALDTDYYLRIVRDESVGTYGTLYCYIYTDSDYKNLVDKLTVTLTENKDFRYAYGVSGKGNGLGGVSIDCVIDYLLIDTHPYTLENCLTRIRDVLNEDTASFWTDTELTRILNDAVREVAASAECIERTEDITTSNGTRLTAFTANKAVYAEYIPGSGTPTGLIRIHPKQAGYVPVNGVTPQYFWEAGSYIGIEPLPNSAYTIRLYVQDYPASDISSNVDLAELPEEYRFLPVLYTISQAFRKASDYGPSAQIMGIFYNELFYNRKLFSREIVDGIENMQVPDYVKVIQDGGAQQA